MALSTSSVSALLFVLCIGLVPRCSSAPSGAFLGPTVSSVEVETSLQEVFEMIKAGGRGLRAPELAKIEASIWQTFQALPKNAAGRLSPPAVRYVVHKYFAKQHGWIIRGLEPDAAGPNVSAAHGASILQDKAPALVEALLESRQSGAGLAMDDVVVMIATLQHLIVHESVSLLESSYLLNNQSSLEAIGRTDLEAILQSYLMLFGQGANAETKDAAHHQNLKAYLAENAGLAWDGMVEYQRDALMNYDFARQDSTSPFGPPRYPFEAAMDMVQDLTHGYGSWQNEECVDMKEALVSLDAKGTGRVSLGAFYNGTTGKTWQFSESVEMLRDLGALDESGWGGPKVLIANYLAQPTNCIATSAYYSVCCLNECEAVMNEIEGAVQAPTASADRLLHVVGGISSATVEAPREIPRALTRKLREVAAEQGGDVTLHGRLFSQWLHFAFPNECAYPHAQGAGTLTASEWFNAGSKVVDATHEERQQHIEAEAVAAAATAAPPPAAAPAAQVAEAAEEDSETCSPPSADGAAAPPSEPPMAVAPAPQVPEAATAGKSQEARATDAAEDDESCGLSSWSDGEQLHFSEEPGPSPAARPRPWRQVLRLLAQVVMIAVVAKTGWAFLGEGKKAEAGRWSDPTGKDSGLLLPM